MNRVAAVSSLRQEEIADVILGATGIAATTLEEDEEEDDE